MIKQSVYLRNRVNKFRISKDEIDAYYLYNLHAATCEDLIQDHRENVPLETTEDGTTINENINQENFLDSRIPEEEADLQILMRQQA